MERDLNPTECSKNTPRITDNPGIAKTKPFPQKKFIIKFSLQTNLGYQKKIFFLSYFAAKLHPLQPSSNNRFNSNTTTAHDITNNSIFSTFLSGCWLTCRGKTHQWFILACDIAGNNDNVCSSTCYSIRQIHSALINDSKKNHPILFYYNQPS